MERYDMALIGGDERTAYMLPCLLEKGYRVICYGTAPIPPEDENTGHHAESLEEAVEQSRCLIGGIPFLKEGKLFSRQPQCSVEMEKLYHCMKKTHVIFGGVIPEDFVERCAERDIPCHDFMKDEALAVFNAIATAEGAILEALLHQKTNLHGSSSLVLGYGRCGRVLAEKLKGMGARVTVCSRSRVELACADALGMDILLLNDLEDKIQEYEYIYNTIPAVLLQKNMLKRMRRDVLVIDIASVPGGVDYEAAGGLEIHARHCLGLPGKYAPKISAKGLVEYVTQSL